MPLLLQLTAIDRSDQAITTVELASVPYHSAGGSGWSATQYPALLDQESLDHQISIDRDVGASTTWISFKRKPIGGETTADGLDGVEIVGKEADLIFVGTVTYPDKTTSTYTLAVPYRYQKGLVVEGSYLRALEGKVGIQGPPGPLTRPALRKFLPWGPGVYQPAGAGAYADWEVYDPPGDTTVMIHFWLSREHYEAGGTQFLATNGDYRFSLVDGAVRAKVNHATTDAQVDSPKLTPERFYAAWFLYDFSEKEIELFTWEDGADAPVSHGTDAGSGALDANGVAWRIGSSTSTTNDYEGHWSDFAIFTAIITEAVMTNQIRQGFQGNQESLYVWIEGEMENDASLIDNAVDVDKGGGLVGIPATAHVFGTAGGNVVTLAGTSAGGGPDYDGRHVLDATTSTNELVIPATFIGGTFPASPQATATGPVTIFDKAVKNDSSRRDATPVGCIAGTTFGGAIADSPGAEPQTSEDVSTGTVMDRVAGSCSHYLGRAVGYDPLAPTVDFELFGDPTTGIFRFDALHEQGVEVTIASRVTSLLALWALSGTTVGAYEGAAVARIGARDEGAVAAEVLGMGCPYLIKNIEFDGVDDDLDLGTGLNATLTDSFTIRLKLSYAPPSDGSTVEIFTNKAAAGGGLKIEDLPDPLDDTKRVFSAGLHLALSVITDLTWSYTRGGVMSFEATMVVTRTGAGPTYDWDSDLYIDGVSMDTHSSSWAAVASVDNLYLGRNVAGSTFWAGNVSEICIMDEAKSATWAEQKLGEPLYHQTAAGAVTSLDGGAAVGFPVVSHPWATGDTVTGTGFTEATYNADLAFDADLSTDTLVALTVAYVAETLTGEETFHDAGISELWHMGWQAQGVSNYPPTNYPSTVGSVTATITGATWRSAGVPLTSPRGVIKTLCLHAPDGGVHGRGLDFSGTSDWSQHPVQSMTAGEAEITTWELIWRVLDSFDGWVSPGVDGVLTFGRYKDPFDQAADHTFPENHLIGGMPNPADGPSSPWNVETTHTVVHKLESPGDLALATPRDRLKWGRRHRTVSTPVPNAQEMFPTEGEPLQVVEWWANRAGAAEAGAEMATYLQYRRRAYGGVPVLPAWWTFENPTSGRLLPGEYVQFTHPDAGGTVKAVIKAVRFSGSKVLIDVERIRLV